MNTPENEEENPLVPVTRFEISKSVHRRGGHMQKAVTLYVLSEGKEIEIDMALTLGIHFANKSYKGKPLMRLAEEKVPTEVRLCFRKGGEAKISSEDLAAWISRVETEIFSNRKPRSKNKPKSTVR